MILTALNPALMQGTMALWRMKMSDYLSIEELSKMIDLNEKDAETLINVLNQMKKELENE